MSRWLSQRTPNLVVLAEAQQVAIAACLRNPSGPEVHRLIAVHVAIGGPSGSLICDKVKGHLLPSGIHWAGIDTSQYITIVVLHG